VNGEGAAHRLASAAVPARPRPLRLTAWRKVALMLVSLAVSGLLIEGACRVWVAWSPGHRLLDRWEFRATRPAPYRDAAYFDAEFLRESAGAVRVVEVPGRPFVVHGDVAGRHFNVRDGLRVTAPESVAAPRVLVYGGSTVFGQEVPDGETIPSRLQSLLNARGPTLRVVNVGTVSMTTPQLVERLLGTELHRGDHVVFYGGLNDILYPVYSGYRRGWRPGQASYRPLEQLGWYHRVVSYGWLWRFRRHSAAVRLMTDMSERTRPATVTDLVALDQAVSEAVSDYARALAAGHAYATAHGARFWSFLQPNLFAQSRRSAYEESLLANYLQTPPGLDAGVAVGYPALRGQLDALRSRGLASFDLSRVLDARRAGEEVYLDYCHVNHVANARIAAELYRAMFGAGGASA
jgi:hypothetical protein